MKLKLTHIVPILSLGLTLSLIADPSLSQESPAHYNCLTREVWSPEKQAFCDQQQQETQKDNYQSIDLNSIDAKLTGNDPSAIALAAFSLKEMPEGYFEQNLSAKTLNHRQQVVIMTQIGFNDDSVRGAKYLLEFEPTKTGKWRMIWAGKQWLCQPDRGSQEWTIEQCL